MTIKNNFVLGIAAILALLSACSPAPTANIEPTSPPFTPTQGSTPSPPATETSIPMPPESTAPAGAEALVNLAKADLAQRLNTAEDQIHLQSVTPREWRDSSLGCPVKGMMYAQVITPGFKIILEFEGQTYSYHTDTRTRVVYCGQ